MFRKISCQCLVLLSLVSCLQTAHSGEVAKVAVFTGEFDSKVVVEAVGTIYAEQPALRAAVMLQVYTPRDLSEQALNTIGVSRLVLLLHRPMDDREERRISEVLLPHLEKVVRAGGIVYDATGEHLFPKGREGRGFMVDAKIRDYVSAGGPVNIENGLLYAMTKALGVKASYAAPATVARPGLAFGLYERRSQRVTADYQQYLEAYRLSRPGYDAKAPWIGIVLLGYGTTEGTNVLDMLAKGLESAGFNVLVAYGYPSEKAVEKFFFDSDGKSRVRVVVALAMKMGVNPEVALPILTKLGVPVINAITSYGKSYAEWKQSPIGLDLFERGWTIAQPELAGAIQPIVVGTHETEADTKTGLKYVEERGVPARVAMLVERVKRWIVLQRKPNRDKQVAILYYNYPPGKQNIGASYLNVLPESLWQVLSRLKEEGYNVDGMPATKQELKDAVLGQRNLGKWASGELDRLARTATVTRIDMRQYAQWLGQLPAEFRAAVVKAWGPPGQDESMAWRDSRGEKTFILPTLRYGNVLLCPQSDRGGGQNDVKSYHDPTLPPPHQYVTFYLYLRQGFRADAIVHFGTHGTHEWLPGKEAGLADEDPPEALIQDVPNIYPFLVDNVGEGLQAKRRGQAVMVDHMTPPLDKAGLDKDLRLILGLVNDYDAAKEQSLPLAEAKRVEISRLAAKKGLLLDLGLTKVEADDDVEVLEHYLREILEKNVPFGLHTFGVAPDEKSRRSTAEAILAVEGPLAPEDRQRRIEELDQKMVLSAKQELDSFVAALAGRYVPVGPGNDPIRCPQSLPTGRNFYSFDPNRIPSLESYAMGVKLAQELLADYQRKHGQVPDKLAFTLWAVETIRHEGVVESQILNLLGTRPTWDKRGRVTGVELISRKELGHPRVDVVITPSGLYRDIFPNLMTWMDEAVSLAREQNEGDNSLRAHILAVARILRKKGIAADKAQRLASVRMFTPQSGVYGTGLDLIPESRMWENQQQVADAYFRHMGHLYGQGFWGDTAQEQAAGRTDLGQDLFKQALSGTKLAVHSMSSNVVGTIDNDDFYEYLGGTALAVRVLDGKSPDLYVTDMSHPTQTRQTALARVMGEEMRTRYLNPKWIDRMMGEGYAGARYIGEVVENLWGWQVTVPEAVGPEKWQELYETYVEDKHGLNVKEAFRKSGNPWAHQAIMARMLEAVRKKYWTPDQKVVETLAREYAENAAEHGMACSGQTCDNPALTQFTASTLTAVPGLERLSQKFTEAVRRVNTPGEPSPAAQGKPEQDAPTAQNPRGPDAQKPRGPAPAKAAVKQVEGFQMQELPSDGRSSAPIPYLFLGGFLVFTAIMVLGWRRRRLG